MITKVNPSTRRRAQSLQFPCPVRICHSPDLTWHFLIWKTPGSLVGTALYVGQETRNTTCNERSSEIHVWSDACCEVYAQTLVQFLQRGTQANDLASCEWIYFGDHLLVTYSSTQQIVALSTAESENISITKGAAHALEVRSAMVEFGMTCVGWTGSGHETHVRQWVGAHG